MQHRRQQNEASSDTGERESESVCESESESAPDDFLKHKTPRRLPGPDPDSTVLMMTSAALPPPHRLTNRRASPCLRGDQLTTRGAPPAQALPPVPQHPITAAFRRSRQPRAVRSQSQPASPRATPWQQPGEPMGCSCLCRRRPSYPREQACAKGSSETRRDAVMEFVMLVKVSELRQQLRQCGLPVSGTKPALLERLKPLQRSCPPPLTHSPFLTPPTAFIIQYQDVRVKRDMQERQRNKHRERGGARGGATLLSPTLSAHALTPTSMQGALQRFGVKESEQRGGERQQVSELRQQLRQCGLPVSGTKPALLERLKPLQRSCPPPLTHSPFLTPPTAFIIQYQDVRVERDMQERQRNRHRERGGARGGATLLSPTLSAHALTPPSMQGALQRFGVKESEQRGGERQQVSVCEIDQDSNPASRTGWLGFGL
ncbi:UNVERIFIED_CONTAM: hypothetical protein FKN15_021698 [Acipenser sinensis]